MIFLRFIPSYIIWHYTYALKNLLGVWTNYLWFVWNFFSIPILFRTFFAPWKKMGEEYKGGFDIKDFFSTLIINFFMRLVGVAVRFFVILLGLVALIITFFLGIFAYIVWLAMPVVLLTSIYSGIKYLSI